MSCRDISPFTVGTVTIDRSWAAIVSSAVSTGMPAARSGLAASLVFSACFFTAANAGAFSATDANTIFDDYNNALYIVTSGNGYYKADTGGGRTDFWKQAEEIEMIIDAYERSGSSVYKGMITETINGFIITLSVLVFIVNVVRTQLRGEQTPEDPWDARTLEWLTSSPPPEYNFASVPVVASWPSNS